MFGKYLKNYILRSHITIEQLSDLSGIPFETIRNIVYGRSKHPRIDTVSKICEALRISLDELTQENYKNTVPEINGGDYSGISAKNDISSILNHPKSFSQNCSATALRNGSGPACQNSPAAGSLDGSDPASLNTSAADPRDRRPAKAPDISDPASLNTSAAFSRNGRITAGQDESEELLLSFASPKRGENILRAEDQLLHYFRQCNPENQSILYNIARCLAICESILEYSKNTNEEF